MYPHLHFAFLQSPQHATASERLSYSPGFSNAHSQLKIVGKIQSGLHANPKLKLLHLR